MEKKTEYDENGSSQALLLTVCPAYGQSVPSDQTGSRGPKNLVSQHVYSLPSCTLNSAKASETLSTNQTQLNGNDNAFTTQPSNNKSPLNLLEPSISSLGPSAVSTVAEKKLPKVQTTNLATLVKDSFTAPGVWDFFGAEGYTTLAHRVFPEILG